MIDKMSLILLHLTWLRYIGIRGWNFSEQPNIWGVHPNDNLRYLYNEKMFMLSEILQSFSQNISKITKNMWRWGGGVKFMGWSN